MRKGLTAPDQESSLVEWMNELVYLFDWENIIFKRFDITHLNNTQLRARACGEKVDSLRHKLKTRGQGSYLPHAKD